MNSNKKKFLVVGHNSTGLIIHDHRDVEIEDNPAYGEVECRNILTTNPAVVCVSILEPQLDEDGDPLYMEDPDDPDQPLLDGMGFARPLLIERLRMARGPAQAGFTKVLEDWPIVLH